MTRSESIYKYFDAGELFIRNCLILISEDDADFIIHNLVTLGLVLSIQRSLLKKTAAAVSHDK